MLDDDATLLRDYTEHRSEQAFVELVRRHTNLVYSAALRRTGGDAHRAQDVVQFVFNELARQPGRVARHPVLAGWLHTATRNAAINAARAERRRQLYEQQAALTMNEGSDENAGEWDRLRPMLDEVIDGLARDDRDAVLLRYFEERPFAEIGRVLRVSEDAARMRVQRALEKLREALQRRGFASTTSALGAVLANHTVIAAPGLATTVTGVALGSVGAATGLTATKLAVIAGGIAAIIAALTFAPWWKTQGPETLAPLAAGLRATDAGNEKPNDPSSNTTGAGSNLASLRNPGSPANLPAQNTVAPIARSAVARNRARVAQDYYVLFSELQLPDAQREALIGLLVDLRESGADYAAAGAGLGVDVTTDPATFNRSVRALRDKIQDEINTLLGPDGFRRFAEFEDELKTKSYAIALKGTLKNTASPLTTGQADELTRIIQQGAFDPKGEQLIAEASRFLSPEQLTALRQVQDLKINGSKKPKILDAIREGGTQPTSGTNAP
ncbi:MAG TPA: sigma-70 family RNA polymerase sigma factor [Opitutaceae bacterium]|nr:sigma-70 family RNA polymerase sigma factor [Opitutaceae bacterium]